MSNNKNRKHKKTLKLIVGILIFFLLLYFIFRAIVMVNPPDINDNGITSLTREKISENTYKVGNDWLRKSNSGLWEMYVSGKPFEMGVKNGKLTKELAQEQEIAFVKMIRELVPGKFYLNFLKYFTAWFNRALDEYIPLEYQKEIYGISLNASNDFDFIGDKYQRILNYHAAHDIGHALQNMNLVACTSFGAWDGYSSDSSLIIGRNFDFYAGDDFAKNKIVSFVHPEKGYDFAFVTWAGFIGVVSGMNMQGLTVTINAAKSDIPYSAKTPVSIVARDILQYAANIEEAFAIAQKHKTFVSETFLIGSSSDHRTVIIEKSLDTTVLYSQNNDYIISTNHFQDKAFSKAKLNIENRENETSVYRYKRVQELLDKEQDIDYLGAVNLLRDQKGINDEDIGMTNEKSINQLIAHHSVIFKPDEKLMWVSSQPFQLGKYNCYDLDKVFSENGIPDVNKKITIDSLEIPVDSFLLSNNYGDFLHYKEFVNKTRDDEFEGITEKEVKGFIQSNPAFYYTYEKVGDFYRFNQNQKKSIEFYNFALQKEVSSKTEKEKIVTKITDLKQGSDTAN
jgi:hypothetical protein